MGQLVLFDLDRTLIVKDTAGLYVRYEWDEGLVPLSRVARVAWWRLRYTFGWISATQVAERVLLWNNGRVGDELMEHGRQFFDKIGKALVSKRAVERVRESQGRGDTVVIATASTRFIAQPFADFLGVEHLLCSEVEIANGRLTGHVVGPLCYGSGKLARITEFAATRGLSLSDATFFTDSITDLPTLEAVGHPIAVNPDPRLHALALQRGWPVERFGLGEHASASSR